MSVDQVIAEVARDRLFYDESSGGVTLSGGEPLLQADFVCACLEACKRQDFHTALDTCGHAPEEALVACGAHADLILYDLKIMDPSRHERYAGLSNSVILENLERLDREGRRIWIRVPIIPGINDDDENLRAVAEFVRSLRSRPPLYLLPFHRIGSDKYDRLGQPYVMAEIRPPTHERLVEIRQRMITSGLDVRIGG
jgi:pyruvate formate lyase activating enzyme